jgi:hypothetical protein
MPAITGYYKMRSMASIIGLPVFGTKEALKEAIEKTLFINKKLKTPPREELRTL